MHLLQVKMGIIMYIKKGKGELKTQNYINTLVGHIFIDQ